MENRKITVSLSCATCGNADFAVNEDRSDVKCKTCNREYLGGYDELVTFNQAKIDKVIEKTKQEVGEEIKAALTKSLRDAFSGNKLIKFK